MPDKMQCRSLIGIVLQMGGHLLYPVFSADRHTGGDGRADGIRSWTLVVATSVISAGSRPSSWAAAAMRACTVRMFSSNA